MRKSPSILLFFFLTPFFMVSHVQAQSIDPGVIAKKAVEAVQIKPGEVVGLFGGRDHLDMIEAAALEASIAGGRAAMVVTSDAYEKAFWKQVPLKYLGQQNPFYNWLKTMDVYISVLPQTSPAVFDEIPPERMALMLKAYQDQAEELNKTDLRAIMINLPTQAQAAHTGIDYGTFKKMHLAALEADYTLIAKQSNDIAALLKSGSTVKVTTDNGTNFQFNLTNRPVFQMDGVITEAESNSEHVLHRVESLPSGEVSFAPDETSVTGHVVIPSLLCRGKIMEDVSFAFEKGVVTHFKARKTKRASIT